MAIVADKFLRSKPDEVRFCFALRTDQLRIRPRTPFPDSLLFTPDIAHIETRDFEVLMPSKSHCQYGKSDWPESLSYHHQMKDPERFSTRTAQQRFHGDAKPVTSGMLTAQYVDS